VLGAFADELEDERLGVQVRPGGFQEDKKALRTVIDAVWAKILALDFTPL
jgi:hypothetical protein